MMEIKQMGANVHHMLIMINNCLLVGDWFPIVIITTIKIMTIIEWNNWSLYKTTNWDGFVASKLQYSILTWRKEIKEMDDLFEKNKNPYEK